MFNLISFYPCLPEITSNIGTKGLRDRSLSFCIACRMIVIIYARPIQCYTYLLPSLLFFTFFYSFVSLLLDLITNRLPGFCSPFQLLKSNNNVFVAWCCGSYIPQLTPNSISQLNSISNVTITIQPRAVHFNRHPSSPPASGLIESCTLCQSVTPSLFP